MEDFVINSHYKIWIEAEEWAGEWDVHNCNSDVIVEFEDNERWVASFFTYNNISQLTEKNKDTGECLCGMYFWSSDMVLINEISRRNIEEVVIHLLSEDSFQNIFRKL